MWKLITFPEEGLILIFFYYKYYFVSAEGYYVLSDELNKYVVKEEKLRVIEGSLNYLERTGHIEGLRRLGDPWLCSRIRITDSGIQYFRTEINIEALKNSEILKVGEFKCMLEKIEQTSIGSDSRMT